MNVVDYAISIYYITQRLQVIALIPVIATESGWVCSCPDYARLNAKCKHVYAVEYYRRQSVTF